MTKGLTRAGTAFISLATLVALAACGPTPTPLPTTVPPTSSASGIIIPTALPTATPLACLTPPGPASRLTGFGADKSAWEGHHAPDPNDGTSYQPMRGRFPGAASQDVFVGVTFVNGKVTSYFEQFPPMTTAASAESALRKDLPTDSCPLDSPTGLGKCAGQYFHSASLAAAEGTSAGANAGFITLSLQSQYGLSSGQYNPSDVRTAFVAVSVGHPSLPLPIAGSPLANAFCGG